MRKKLVLGAGKAIMENAVNHDLTKHDPRIDLTFDLNNHPYPIKDASFTDVYLISVIEHLIPTPLETVSEIWRILEVGGLLHLKYPLHTSPTIHDDPTHRWFLSPVSFDYVDPRTKYGRQYGFYSKNKFHINTRNNYKDKSMHLVMQKVGQDG